MSVPIPSSPSTTARSRRSRPTRRPSSPTSRTPASARSCCSSRGRASRSGDPRDHPHRSRAPGDGDARRPARRRRRRRRGLLGHRRVGPRGDHPRPRAGAARLAGDRHPGPDRRHPAHAHDGCLRGLLAARPRGAVLDRELALRRPPIVLAWAVLVLAAGCGGSREPAATPAATPTPTATVTVTATPSTAPTPTATASPSPEDQPGGAGDEQPPRVPLEFTLGDGGLRPATISVPAFLGLELIVHNRTDRPQHVTLAGSGDLDVPA